MHTKAAEIGKNSLNQGGSPSVFPDPEGIRYPEAEHWSATRRSEVDSDIMKILVVDDEVNQRTALAGLITRWGYQVRSAANGAEALAELKNFDADVIVTDLNMPVMDGRGLLEEVHRSGSSVQTVVLTGFGNLETALDTVHKLGAFWYVEKPVNGPVLKMIVERAAEKRRLATHTGVLERELASRGMLGDLVGESPAMQELFYLIQQVAPTTATVLITGESGTGKEIVARAIHKTSLRRARPFLAVNCAAMPESLMESELFGHEKGAFTGAVERRPGCFELANGGTLLLDEIGDMPMNTQAKLLRVLEDRRVRRLGSAKEVDLDVRVLASTNRTLSTAISGGTFREDLFFRLNVFEIGLPPLRERGSDVLLITRELLNDLNHKHSCTITDISPEVAAVFTSYNWPGNIRELRNILERAAILCTSGTIGLAHLPRGFAGQPESGPRDTSASVVLEPGTTVDAAERSLIELTLRHTGGNRTRAAEILGISAKTLFNKLREYGTDK
jgi:DNA-binding NtrC family response regulator